VRTPEDTSNFEDYGELPALGGGDALSAEEQRLFAGF
jgi:hypothetical protein